MSLKGLAKLKREGRTSLHAVQYVAVMLCADVLFFLF